MKALILWSLHSSEAISTIIKDSYKQNRQEDDKNQPLAVQSWGRDGDKRRYWLVEGKDDTDFRLYRESNPALKNITWRSVAGSIDEIKAVAEKLDGDGSQAARRLSASIMNAIPRFEATEEVSYLDPLSLSGELTCTETQTPRIPHDTQSTIHASRAWLFKLRRSNSW
jgi:hypothetical protein